MEKKVNWGIIGLGNIATKFAEALKLTDNAILKGISSKSNEKILKFKDLYRIKSNYCFSNYSDLINCDEIEAIYIALPNSMHYQYICECIQANKKILVEKPATQNFSQIKALKDNYDMNKFFYSEGFMYVHSPQISNVIELLKNKKIGNLLSIKSKFGKNILKKKNIFGIEKIKNQSIKNRLFNPSLGGGVILDLGCYPVSLSILIGSIYFDLDINNIKVERVKKQMGSTGVEIDAVAEINFNNKFNANIEASFIRNIGSESEIIGDKGRIIIKDTWHSSSSVILISNNIEKEIINDAQNNSYFYQVKNISNNILEKANKPKQPAMDFNKSYLNMKILDEWKNNAK